MINHETKSDDRVTLRNKGSLSPGHSDRDLEVTQQSARQLADVMVRANRLFMIDLNSKFKEMDISYQKYHLLEFLNDNQEPIMKEISTKMGITDAAATGTVASLEKIGLVQRISNLKDRRKIAIQITAKGREVLNEVRDTIQVLIARAMSADDEGRQEEANNIFAELRTLFE